MEFEIWANPNPTFYQQMNFNIMFKNKINKL
jgi:hypothetical protein